MIFILLIFLTFLASFIGMVTGFGTSTTMIPIMLLFFQLNQTLLFVGIIHLFSNIGKLFFSLEGLRFKFLLYFVIPSIIATSIGARLTALIRPEIIIQFLGLIFIIYVLIILINPVFHFKQSITNTILGGTISGFTSGLIGIGGSIRGFSLSLYNLSKLKYISTLGVIGTITDLSRILVYFINGFNLTKYLWIVIIICIPISMFGSFIGRKVLNYIDQEKFRYVIGIALTIIGIIFLINPSFFIH